MFLGHILVATIGLVCLRSIYQRNCNADFSVRTFYERNSFNARSFVVGSLIKGLLVSGRIKESYSKVGMYVLDLFMYVGRLG